MEAQDRRRSLGLFSAIAIVAGSMIGSGIFLITPNVARTVGNPAGMILIWVLSGAITICGALSYGRLTAIMPEAGGQYIFLRRSWGNIPAFLYGWVFFWVIQTGFMAAVAIAFSRYFGELIPEISTANILSLPYGIDLTTEKLLAISTLLCLTWLNTKGTKFSSNLQNIFTILKVIALVIIIVSGLTFGHNLNSMNWTEGYSNQFSLKEIVTLISISVIGPLTTSDGWNYVTFIGGDVKNPSKTLPRALVYGAFLVVILYLLVNLSYLNVLTFEEIQTVSNDKIAAAMMNTTYGSIGSKTIALVILISTFGCLNGLIFSGAKVFCAMARDGLLFKAFATINPKNHSPTNSLWAQCIWAILLAFSGSFITLLSYTLFTSLLFYIVTLTGLFILRKESRKVASISNRLENIFPIFFIISASIICFYLLISPETCFTSIAGVLFTLSGLPIYIFWNKTKEKFARK